MSVPEKAIEASAKGVYERFVANVEAHDDREIGTLRTWGELEEWEREQFRSTVANTLADAEKYIRAQELRDYADELEDGRLSFRDTEALLIRERAERIENERS